MSTDTLVFYNATNGNGAAAQLDTAGNCKTLQSFHGFASGWTHIVPSGGLLFYYNAANGAGAVGKLDQNSNHSTLSSRHDFAWNWTHIVPSGDLLLFYNAANGTGAACRLDTVGNITTLRGFKDFAWGWTHIVPSEDLLLFYNAANGTGAASRLDTAGNITTLRGFKDFSSGWTHIVPSGDLLLFYNAANGTGAACRLDTAGNITTLRGFKDFSRGWTHIVPSGDLLLFYNAANGTGAASRLDTVGNITTLRGFKDFSSGWTQICSVKTARYRFRIDYFRIGKTRSRHQDTVYVSCSLVVGNRPAQNLTKSMGDLNDGAYTVGLVLDSDVSLDEPVVFNYLIINKGHGDPGQIQQELTNAANNLAKKGAEAAGQAIAKGLDALVGAPIGDVLLPLIDSVLGAAGAWVVGQAAGVIWADCDGPVAIEQVVLTGRQLLDRPGLQKILGDIVPTEPGFQHETFHPGIDSATGCGPHNSEYWVYWTILPL